MSRLLQSRRWVAQTVALLALAVVIPACGGGGPGAPPIVYGISTTSMANGTAGTAYSQTLQVSAGTAPFTWSLLSGTPPAGLTLDGNTGVISGTPAGPAGSTSFTVRVTDANAITDDQVLSIVVTGGIASPLTVNTAALTGATQNSSYSVGLSASGGTPGYTWSITVGALPTGLVLTSSTGVISGTPTAVGGPVNFTVTVTDSVLATASQALSITVNAAMVITTVDPLPQGTVGVAYTQAMALTGGSGGATWSIYSGITPPGLSMAPATGVLSGTPTIPGTYGIRVRVVDNASAEAFKVFSVTINPAPAVTTLVLVPWTLNHPGYNQTLTATGGTGALTWTSGALPAGLTLAAVTGVISGTPTAAGTFNVTFTATDTLGGSGSQILSIVINPVITVTPLTLPAWTINRTGYSQTLVSAGGTGARTWSRTGTIPTGMTFNLATGVLSGTPTAAGTFNFTATSTDSVGATGSQAFAVVINPAPVITTTTAPAWTQNFAYSPFSIASTGGTTPFAWTSTGTLPTGVTLNGGTGVLSGTPTATGTFNFTVTMTDVAGATDSQALSIVINAQMAIPTATPMAQWTRLLAGYNQSVTATGGTGAQVWDISAGALPTSLAISAGGAITGTPSAANTFNFTVRVTDSVGATATKAMSIVINDILSVTTATPMAEHTKDRLGYNQTVAATGGTGAKTWDISAGALPDSLAISAGGAITGTPSVVGTFNFTVRVTDALGATGTKAMSIVINAVLVVTTATPMAEHTKDRLGYNQSVAATGGTGAKTWDISAGALPDSLAISAGGAITGTPSVAGTFNFTVRVTDAVGATGTKAMSIVINAVLVVTTATPMAEHTKDRLGYNQTVVATGGTGAKTWDISAGALPDSLAISAGGAITGTPSVAGTFNFTVRVTDAVGATGTKAMSIVINDVLVVTTATPMAEHTKDRLGYNQSVAATGGTGAKTWDISAGALPDSLSISTGGAITGTPSVAGTFNFTVRVTDSLGATGTKAMSIVINAVLNVTTATPLAAWTDDFAGYGQSLSATGGTGAKTWDISAGALPDSLSISTGGVISGTPSVAGTFNFTVRITDAVGATGTKAMSILINDALVITTATPLPVGTQGVSYGPLTFVATGGTGAHTFARTAGSVPTGMADVTLAGGLSGLPTGSGTSNFTVTVTDSLGATGAKAFALTINASPVTHTTAALPNGIVGSGYHVTVQAVGGTQPYTFSIFAGGLPGSLTLNANTGVISGTPTAPEAGTAVDVTIRVSDSSGPVQTADRQFLFNIGGATPNQGSLTINTLRLPDASLAPYNQQIGVWGGTAPHNFFLDPKGNPLPGSLSLGINGIVSGTPTAGQEGQYTFGVIVTDSTASSARANVVLVIGAQPLSISTNTVPNGTEGAAYTTTRLIAVGGQPPYTWDTAEDTDGPQGMVLTSTGIFHGIPRQHGTFRSVFCVRDSGSPARIATQSITYTIAEPASGFRVQSATLANATDGTAYNHAFTVTGGAAKHWVSDTQAFDAVGLTLNPATGVLSGTPTASGVFQFIIGAVADGAAPRPTSVANSILTILPQAFGITTTSLPDIDMGVAYDTGDLGRQGGTGPFTWSIDPASPTRQDFPATGLPTGFSINAATGAISGLTTASSGNGLELLVRVTDSSAQFRRAYILISFVRTHLRLSFGSSSSSSASPVLNFATQGAAYSTLDNPLPINSGSQDLTQTDLFPGTSAPAGLTLDPARRVFSGTPTVPGRYVMQLRLSDRWGGTGGVQEVVETGEDRAILEVLQAAGFRISTRNLPSAREGTAYSAAIVPENGTVNPYAFAVSAGALPPGLILDAVNGIISGTPTVAGIFGFEISMTQSATTRKMAYELAVDPKLAIAVRTNRLPQGPIGVSYNGTLDAQGGPVTWSDAGSATTFVSLGLALDTNTGVVTGAPTAASGFYQVRVSATNGPNNSTRMVGILIEPLPITAVGFKGIGFVGQAYTATNEAFGGTAPYTVTLAPGEQFLPGLTMNAAGVVSGTATMQSSFSQVLLKIVDNNGRIGYGRFDGITIGADLPALGFGIDFDDEIQANTGELYVSGDKTFTAEGGTPNYTYSVPVIPARPNDSLPDGITVNTINSPPGTADLVGTFAATGEFEFVLRATDGVAATADRLTRVRVRHQFFVTDPNVETVRLPDGSPAAAYPATQLKGYAPGVHSWAFEGGAPPGLTLSASGIFSTAAPLPSGTIYFRVRHTSGLLFSVGRIKLVIE